MKVILMLFTLAKLNQMTKNASHEGTRPLYYIYFSHLAEHSTAAQAQHYTSSFSIFLFLNSYVIQFLNFCFVTVPRIYLR